MDTFKLPQRDLEPLGSRTYDVLIIGGGISGAWLALHCAQSGYSTALIDRGDYAAQTSSASSKLLHGGIRYLQQMQFFKVRESAMERAHYVYAAPHMSKAVPFIIPTYNDLARSKLLLNCGMLTYRLLCLGENSVIDSAAQPLPAARSISATELNDLYDLGTESHTGGVVFYERHMSDSERMVLSILRTARELGANIQNYVSAQHYLHSNGVVHGVAARDTLAGRDFDISSRLVINATGPWIDSLNAVVRAAGAPATITGYAVGAHVITRQLSNYAIAITTAQQGETTIDRGGRHVFVIPWRGHSLIGTSYDEIKEADFDLGIKGEQVTQLLDAVNEGLPHANLTPADLVSGYSGLYPLDTKNIDSSVYQGSGEYQIIDHQQRDKVSGLVTALGAKFTTGRKLSSLTMRLVADKLGGSCNLDKRKLHDGQFHNIEEFRKVKRAQYADRFDDATIEHLISQYGSEIDQFIAHLGSEGELTQAIVAGQPDILGQVSWAVRHEQAYTLSDIVFRRTAVGFLGLSAVELRRVANLMASECGWDEDQLEQQISRTQRRLSTTQLSMLTEQA